MTEEATAIYELGFEESGKLVIVEGCSGAQRGKLGDAGSNLAAHANETREEWIWRD